MRKTLNIINNSLRQTFQELGVNKLRTALSLIGVAFGILCIIGVLVAVSSFERNIQNQINSLGSNTTYIDKWDYSGGPDYPFWKYRARPVMEYNDVDFIKQRSDLAENVTFLLQSGGNISYKNDEIENAPTYGILEDQTKLQPLSFADGRYISSPEFNSGSPVCLLGYDNAEKLFGIASAAIGKQIEMRGKKITIVGVIKKEGKNFIGWDYDNCIMLPYNFFRQIFVLDNSNPVIIVKGKKNVTPASLNGELKGIMRQARRLSPTTEDNFSLNSVEAFSKTLSDFFVTIDIVGSIIGGISLIVGMFGIANIMFVTVKERTGIIGLKKAIGAKRSSILFEFLMESTILCIIGGAMGLMLVFLEAVIMTKAFDFPVYISLDLLIAALIICLVVGILAGIFPASRAAKLDPVVAIRS
ncbi:MAG: ABC transporter permease [Ferruginibacter sp.]